jgi:hypothetical protein
METNWAFYILSFSQLIICISFWLCVRFYREKNAVVMRKFLLQEEYLKDLKDALRLVNRGAMGIGQRLHRSEKIITNLLEVTESKKEVPSSASSKNRDKITSLIIQGVESDTIIDTFSMSRGEADILQSLSSNKIKKSNAKN